jgi:Uncharacterized alpha/beta hydrolase domain (DUF2235)
MANDQAIAAQACQRDVSNDKAGPFQDCSDVIHISVFFDGTGNNKEADRDDKKWSNPARMWSASELFANRAVSKNVYPIYVAGVGTPFNGKGISALDEKAIAVEDAMPGSVGGAGGTRRLDFAQQAVNEEVRKALLSRAQALGGQVAKYATAGKDQSFGELSKALAKHRLVKVINVSIFGFSRGAALARAFCNQWLWDCEESHGNLTYKGTPIRFGFLGLFDTVASFGVPSGNVANSLLYGGFKGRDLVVDDRVERCVHFVAGHELRFSFPVDLIRKDGKLNGDWLETTYPGVHSDVGGGYKPNDVVKTDQTEADKLKEQKAHQGQTNNYARVPMMDMMREAENKGVRLMGYEKLEKDQGFKALFQERFECKPETLQAYKAYRAGCNPGGTIENQMQQHMAALYSAYGTLHRKGIKTVTQRQHDIGQSWSGLAPADMAKEIDNYESAIKRIKDSIKPSVQSIALGPLNSAFAVKDGIYAMWIAPQQWQLDAWRKTAPEGLMNFVHTCVHDSKVGFINNVEPFSYFSKRGVSESERSVQGWFEQNVSRPVGHAYEAVKDKTNEVIDEGKKVAKATAEKVGNAVDSGIDAAKTGAKAAGNAVGSAMQTAGKAAADMPFW